MSDVFVYRDMGIEYPDTIYAGSPSTLYPEYSYHEISTSQNDIYDSIRKTFHMMGLDEEHYGSNKWNPLGKYVYPNDVVLVKPNMVIHQNTIKENGEKSLYTNVAIVRAVTDYILKALGGSGQVIIADAPVQSSDWGIFCSTSGYKEMMEFYERNNERVSLVDLRHYQARYQGKIVIREEKKMPYKSVVVNLGRDSAFASLSDIQNKGLRITDYDNRIMESHHTGGKHEYAISSIALEADVIINLPKIKTHRLAGMTRAMKNIVGVNTDKDYLPHYRKGTSSDIGDQHKQVYFSDKIKDSLIDLMNRYVEDKKYNFARFVKAIVVIISRAQHIKEKNRVEVGNWSGNDTIWRTVKDLNQIISRADKNGIMKTLVQRRMLCIGDMVYGGSGEGPLSPKQVKSGCLIVSDDPLKFDAVCASLMGFDYKRIPTIKDLWGEVEITISSNDTCINGKKLGDIRKNMQGRYKPAKGWEPLENID